MGKAYTCPKCYHKSLENYNIEGLCCGSCGYIINKNEYFKDD